MANSSYWDIYFTQVPQNSSTVNNQKTEHAWIKIYNIVKAKNG